MTNFDAADRPNISINTNDISIVPSRQYNIRFVLRVVFIASFALLFNSLVWRMLTPPPGVILRDPLGAWLIKVLFALATIPMFYDCGRKMFPYTLTLNISNNRYDVIRGFGTFKNVLSGPFADIKLIDVKPGRSLFYGQRRDVVIAWTDWKRLPLAIMVGGSPQDAESLADWLSRLVGLTPRLATEHDKFDQRPPW